MAKKSAPKREEKEKAKSRAVVASSPPPKTEKFSRLQLTITLNGKDATAQCDIVAAKDDETPYQSSGFGNKDKPLLLEVMRKLSTAYCSDDYITLGIDDQGGLVATDPT